MVTILNYAIKFYDLKENIASKIGTSLDSFGNEIILYDELNGVEE